MSLPAGTPAHGGIFSVTPSQTVGPYFGIGLPYAGSDCVVPEGSPGAIRIVGVVRDGEGAPVRDHLIEVWQADADGGLADLHGAGPAAAATPGFRGFARVGIEAEDGSYALLTVKPGRLPGPDGALSAPHINVSVFARGLLHRVVTRIYFADEPEANAQDPVLARVPPSRRDTLLATPQEGGYRFDIRLQGPGETVFFAI